MSKKPFTLAGLMAAIAVACLIMIIPGCGEKPQQEVTGSQEAPADTAAEKLPDEITLDFATYNLLSLVLNEHGFLEEEFKDDNVKINWVFSQGGNKSMEFLMSGSADFASGAGVASLISFINGNPINTIYRVNTEELSLMVNNDSPIKELLELKGKSIAATPGTNPYIFMVRSLALENLTLKDITVVPLQHPDGKNELLRGRVDAWAGLEPLQSQATLEGARYLYRNIDYTTHVVLSVRSEFAKEYPDAVVRVLKAYERARKWAIDNPEKYQELITRKSKITPEVTKMQLEKYLVDIESTPDNLVPLLVATEDALRQLEILKEGQDIKEIVGRLIDNSYYNKLKSTE